MVTLLIHLTLNGMTASLAGVLLPSDIKIDELASVDQGLPALINGEKANAEQRAKDPDNPHNDPTCWR